MNPQTAKAIAAVLCRVVDYHAALQTDADNQPHLDAKEQAVAEAIEQLPEID